MNLFEAAEEGAATQPRCNRHGPRPTSPSRSVRDAAGFGHDLPGHRTEGRKACPSTTGTMMSVTRVNNGRWPGRAGPLPWIGWSAGCRRACPGARYPATATCRAARLSVEAFRPGRSPARLRRRHFARVTRDKGEMLSLLPRVPVEGDVSVRGSLTGAVQAAAVRRHALGRPGQGPGNPVRQRRGKASVPGHEIFRLARSTSISRRPGSSSTARWTCPASPLFDARLKVIRADVRSIVALFYKPLPLFFRPRATCPSPARPGIFPAAAGFRSIPERPTGKHSPGASSLLPSRDRITFPQVPWTRAAERLPEQAGSVLTAPIPLPCIPGGYSLNEVGLLSGMPGGRRFDLSDRISGSFSRPEVRSTSCHGRSTSIRRGSGAVTRNSHIERKVLACRAATG